MRLGGTEDGAAPLTGAVAPVPFARGVQSRKVAQRAARDKDAARAGRPAGKVRDPAQRLVSAWMAPASPSQLPAKIPAAPSAASKLSAARLGAEATKDRLVG
ncbi:hypothetical protein GCM10011319_26590 [Mameliella alba]|nr:hypothetical protein GCM10011319_26590 [Mameliella alba]